MSASFSATLQKVIGGVNRTDRVANRAFDELAGFERRLDGGFHVADIIHRVEDAKHIDAVGRRPRHEGLDDVIGIVVVTDHVLAAQEHLKTGLRHRGAELTQAFPRRFL